MLAANSPIYDVRCNLQIFSPFENLVHRINSPFHVKYPTSSWNTIFSGGPDEFIENGTKLITGGLNGDKIFCTDQGYARDIDKNGDITLHFEGTIKGRTGKFAGATGSISAIALGSIYTIEGSVSFDGSIT